MSGERGDDPREGKRARHRERDAAAAAVARGGERKGVDFALRGSRSAPIEMKRRVQGPIMDTLPDEIMILIFKHASTYDLATSFQYVCARWNYLINTCERIWRGDVKLKGLTERECGTKLCHVLRRTPKLKYLQIGYPHPNALHERIIEEVVALEYAIATREILNTIRDFNKEIEYLQIIDRLPGTESLLSVINKPRFKRLSVIFDRLCDRREKISDLKKIFSEVPELDNLCINFSQRIHFQCEKKDFSSWKITHDSKTDIIDEFS